MEKIGKGLFDYFPSEEDNERVLAYMAYMKTPEGRAEWLRGMDKIMEIHKNYCKEHPDSWMAAISDGAEESLDELKKEIFDV